MTDFFNCKRREEFIEIEFKQPTTKFAYYLIEESGDDSEMPNFNKHKFKSDCGVMMYYIPIKKSVREVIVTCVNSTSTKISIKLYKKEKGNVFKKETFGNIKLELTKK